MLGTKQLMDPIDFHSIFFLPCKSMGFINLFFFQQDKEIHTGLKQLEGE